MPSPTPRSGILIGVDGSPCSMAAVRWAAWEATMRNIPLTLVHVLAATVSDSRILALPAAAIPAEFFEQREGDARQLLSDAIKVAEDSALGNGIPQINAEVFVSAPAATLVEQSTDAEMVVVGSRGQSTWRRALLGSVSTGLIHHARCPVAVIHDDLSSPQQPTDSPVLVGIDGSPASELATAIAFDEASWRGVELVALHAWNDADMSHIPTIEWPAMPSAAQKTLAERLAGWQERYPDVTVHRLVVGEGPARHLLEKARSAQLVVVGSHGRGGFAGMLLGSVSRAVVHAARVPVIVARRR
ncbi:MAG TPA: universal stress protein [Mycobacterium sp.]|nr:universal stress protein [Mycobacterium sp.]